MSAVDNQKWQARWIVAPDSYLETIGEFPDSSLPMGCWIWPEAYSRAHLMNNFTVSGALAKAELEFHADNEFDLYVNGQQMPVTYDGDFWMSGLQNVGGLIRSGDNNIAIRGYLTNTPKHFLSAVRGAIRLEHEDGREELLQTGDSWKNAARGGFWSNFEPDGWQTTPIDQGLSITSLHPRQVRRSCFFRRDFRLDSKAASAKVNVTAKGFYEMYVNGRRVGKDVMTPDSSNDPVYQTYDVTDYLTGGDNVIAAIMGNGWYNSQSWGSVRVRKPELLVQLSAAMDDGSEVQVVSGDSWKVIASPLLEDDLQFGERYDARQDIDGWNMPQTDTGTWADAEVPDSTTDFPAICQDYEGIRVIKRVRPATKRKLPDGGWLFDFGKNCAGRVCLKVRNANPGDMIRIRMYERLDHDDSVDDGFAWGIYSDVFYHEDNSPDGKASMALKNMDVYTCRGDGEEKYQPRFTYTGFRYACIYGYPGEPGLDDVEFMVMHTDLPVTGKFETGNRMLSDISAAVLRTYCSNIHGGPTDCPTREKNFWNGDIQAFAQTACWYLDNSRFLAHWTSHGRKCGGDVYGWGDEEYIVPWVLYRYYGDVSTLKEKYPVIQQLTEERGENLACTNAPYRDHLAMKNVPEDFFAACYQCYMFKTVSRIAAAIGKDEDALRYEEVFRKLNAEFNDKYFEEASADYSPHCQSGVVLPLAFGLVPEDMREKVGARLNEYVIESDFHPTVGFIAIQYLLPLLCDFGYTCSALKIIMQKTFPSWGFMLDTGATTTTESWWGHERGLEASMNHFAYGSVGRWFFEYLGGIRLDPEVSAFKRFVLKPVFYSDHSHIEVSHKTRYGEIRSSWKTINTKSFWRWNFTVPENTTALVHLPEREPEEYKPGTYSLDIHY